VELSREQQTHIFEPLFDHEGKVIPDEWGRPQNDGPALRSITLIRFAHLLLKQGRRDDVVQRLYRPGDTDSLIAKDLRTIIKHGDYGFDIWEEVGGYHFYTRMVHRKAYKMGQVLASQDGLDDPDLADACKGALVGLQGAIETHWSEADGYLLATKDSDRGIMHKRLHLDSQVILAVLHGNTGDFFTVNDDKVLATVSSRERRILSKARDLGVRS